MGFTVARLEPGTGPLHEAGVRFHLEPCDAAGGLRIAFFYDPDGTLLELVERNPEYDEVLDADLVAAERATFAREPQLGAPGFEAAVVERVVDPGGAQGAPAGFRPVGGPVLVDDDGLQVVLEPPDR